MSSELFFRRLLDSILLALAFLLICCVVVLIACELMLCNTSKCHYLSRFESGICHPFATYERCAMHKTTF